MPFSFKVRNFVGITKADFDIDGFTIIRGHNSVGKTSLLMAVRAALGVDLNPLGLSGAHSHWYSSKSATSTAIVEGKSGFYEGSWTPTGGLTAKDEFPVGPNCRHCVDATDFSAKMDDRARLDLWSRLSERPENFPALKAEIMAAGASENEAQDIVAQIGLTGYDQACNDVKERGKHYKRRWQDGYTKFNGRRANYGLKRGATYQPDGWMEGNQCAVDKPLMSSEEARGAKFMAEGKMHLAKDLLERYTEKYMDLIDVEDLVEAGEDMPDWLMARELTDHLGDLVQRYDIEMKNAMMQIGCAIEYQNWQEKDNQLTKLVEHKKEMMRLHQNIITCSNIARVLGPGGYRTFKLNEWLAELNRALEEYDGWGLTRVGDDMHITFGGRPVQVCSESEKWRADAAIKIAACDVNEGPLVVLDEAEILDDKNWDIFRRMLEHRAENYGKKDILLAYTGQRGQGWKPDTEHVVQDSRID